MSSKRQHRRARNSSQINGRTMLGLLQLELLIHNVSSGPSQYFERENQGNKTGGKFLYDN